MLALYMGYHAVGFMAGLLFSVAGMYFMIYGIGNLSDLYTRSIAGVIIAFGGFVTIMAGIEWLEDVE